MSCASGEVSRGHSSMQQRADHRKAEVSHASEGLNITMFQMQQGGMSSLAISGTGQTK